MIFRTRFGFLILLYDVVIVIVATTGSNSKLKIIILYYHVCAFFHYYHITRDVKVYWYLHIHGKSAGSEIADFVYSTCRFMQYYAVKDAESLGQG